MRAATVLLFGLAAAVPAGCTWLDKMRVRPTPPVGGGPLETKEAGQFVEYLNRQAGYLQSVRYDDVSLSVSAPGQQFVPRLREGTLACAPPRYFRLMSGLAIGGTQLDVGSNPAEFWLYVKPADTYVFCSHDDFARGKANLPADLPFDPDWVLQALGMLTYPTGPDAPRYTAAVDQRERLYSLSWDARTPRGEAVTKAIVFAGDPADGTHPQVLRHVVKDAAGKVIASADIKEVRFKPVGTDPRTGKPASVEVPTRVALAWPPQQFKADLSLSRERVNELTPEQFDRLFHKPDIQGSSPVNLAGAQFRPSSYRGAAPGPGRPRTFGAWRW